MSVYIWHLFRFSSVSANQWTFNAVECLCSTLFQIIEVNNSDVMLCALFKVVHGDWDFTRILTNHRSHLPNEAVQHINFFPKSEQLPILKYASLLFPVKASIRRVSRNKKKNMFLFKLNKDRKPEVDTTDAETTSESTAGVLSIAHVSNVPV